MHPADRYDPFTHAESLGITVAYRPLRASNGLWIPDFNTILLQPRMRVMQERCVLSHEVAHALLGHRDDRPKHEVAADRLAAQHLIQRDELRAVMAWTEDEARWSQELGVTPKLLRVFLKHPPLTLVA